MRLLERHYTHAFLRAFGVIGIGLTALITLISSFRSSGELALGDPSALEIVYVTLLRVPENLVSVMPFAVLIAALLTVGHASGALELVAVTAAGGRLRNTFAPLLATALVLSLLSFAIAELAVPACERKSMEIRSRIMGVTSKLKLTGGNIWLRTGDGSMARLGFYSRASDSYGDISIFSTQGSRLIEVLRAREAKHLKEKGFWRLGGVTLYNVDTGRIEKLDSLEYPHLPEPSGLAGGQNFTSRMGAIELMQYLRKLKAAGFRNPELGIELHSHFASPLVNLIMMLIGISVAARRSLGALRAGAVGIMVTAMYWLALTMGNTLGIAGVLPHVLAAWMGPAIFFAGSLWLYLKIPE